MVVVSDAGGEPHAMVVKPVATSVAELAVLGAIRNHYLLDIHKNNRVVVSYITTDTYYVSGSL